MILALDSSILIELQNGNKDVIKKIQELKEVHQSISYIPFIVYFEVYGGILKKLERNQQEAYKFLQLFPLLQPTKKTAEILAELKKKYDELGEALPLADLMIASQVKEHNLLLVTKDTDFNKIQEIKKIIY